MFFIRVNEGSGCVLRRTWQLTGDARLALRARWTIEEMPGLTKGARSAGHDEGNQPVTEMCDTETVAECV